MIIDKTMLEGVYILQPRMFGDNRGFFMESWNKKTLEEAGLYYDFVQDNHSSSTIKGTLRGIHFQKDDWAQAKLVRCICGAVLDVVVDLRRDSKTFLKWIGVELTEDNKKELLIPRGFGHAFLTLTDNVEFLYKADNYYNPQFETGIRWNDPTLNINWGIDNPILSDKDANLPYLNEVDDER